MLLALLAPNGVQAQSLPVSASPTATAGPGQCSAPSTTGFNIWAVTTGTACADNLPFGPNAMTDTQTEPYVSTCYADTLHDKWLQEIDMGDGTPGMSIQWNFQTVQTVQNRFVRAVAQAEPVDWTVCYNGTTIQKSGLWWFSKPAGNYTSLFVSGGAGLKFSQDDGLWGAGNGELNGDHGNTYAKGNWAGQAEDFWGTGNRDKLDHQQCPKVYFGDSYNGVSKPQRVDRMYVNGYPKCPISTCSMGLEANDKFSGCVANPNKGGCNKL